MPPTTQQLRSRGLVLTAAVSVALISTGSAYLAMVAFGIDVLDMTASTAYATAGVFELSLVTVALLAREAAKDNRPGGTLLALTWLLSSASGAFAAWHELFIDHPVGAAIFRFLVPLLAALMWHLALIGDRHLATGMSWSGLRQARRMHALFLSTEDLFRAQSFHDGSRTSRRRLLRAEAARRRARAIALRTVPPTEMRSQVAAWSEAMAAVGDGTADVARLHADDRRRLTSLLVDDGAPGVRDHERRAVEAVAAEVDATRIAAGVPQGEIPSARPAVSTPDTRVPRRKAQEDRGTDGGGRAIEGPWTPSDRYDSDRQHPGPAHGPVDERPFRAPGERAAAAVAALTGAAPHAAGVRPIGAPDPRAETPVRPPTGSVPIAMVRPERPRRQQDTSNRPNDRPVERPAANDERGSKVRASARAPEQDAARRTAGSGNQPPARQPGQRLDEVAVNRIIDLFAQGVPVRSIAQEMRVSESTVRKRLKDFEATGSIPVVRT